MTWFKPVGTEQVCLSMLFEDFLARLPHDLWEDKVCEPLAWLQRGYQAVQVSSSRRRRRRHRGAVGVQPLEEQIGESVFLLDARCSDQVCHS